MNSSKKTQFKYIIGIDEVGRGPLAGPVTLCAIIMKYTMYQEFHSFKNFSGLKDSKKLSEMKRGEWRAKILKWQKRDTLQFSVFSSTAQIIDRKGLTFAINHALIRCLKKLQPDPATTLILLDGGLKAPAQYIQQTIVKGDEKEPIISLASIMAKTDRDRKMTAWAKQFPAYGFEINKGYGTLMHRTVIQQKGISPLHRKLFLRKLLNI